MTEISKSKKIQKMFNDISPRYDLLNRLLSFRRDVSWRKKAVARVGIADGDKVLDLACGTGDMILTILGKADCEVVGADFSEKMLEICSKKVPVPLVAADACFLPFNDGTFDKITMAFGFRNVTDKPKALKEMFRVLKTGGKICILEFSQPKSKVFAKLYRFYFKKVLPFAGGLISGNRAAYRYLPDSVDEFPKENEYRKMIADAGFSGILFTYCDFGICNAAVAGK